VGDFVYWVLVLGGRYSVGGGCVFGREAPGGKTCLTALEIMAGC